MVADGAFSHKINCITGSKVTAILLNGWILPWGFIEKGLRLQPTQQACL